MLIDNGLMYGNSDPLESQCLQGLAAQAALSCQLPLAWLSLQTGDGRSIWSSHGAAVEHNTAAAFMAHIGRIDEQFQVVDARLDHRFAADPIVAGPTSARLLVGLPIFLPSGERIGALCVAGPNAHPLTDHRLELLRGLAVLASQAWGLAQRCARLSADRGTADCRRCAPCLPLVQGVDPPSPEDVRAAIQRQTDILRLVTEAIPDTVVVVGRDNRYHFVNSAFERYAGLPRERILGRTAMEVLGEVEVARRRPWMRRALGGEAVTFTLDYASPEGTQYLQLSCIPLKMEGGDVDGFVGISQDITQQKVEQDRLAEQVRLDGLTGLLNRRALEQQIEINVRRGRGDQLGFLYIDLDFFKPVNDTYGHRAGDQVLEQFAHRLKLLVRPTDAVARLGGDEFAVLLIGAREQANVEMVAAKVVRAAQQVFDTDAGPVHIGASVGAAFGVNVELGWRELIGRADAHMYQAKAAGRGTVR